MAAVTVGASLLLYNTFSSLDEHGHLANAALLTGRNWEQSIYSLGSYYFKYGTAPVYYLPLLLIKDPVWRYRACLIIISLLVSLTAPVAYTIARRYYKVEDKISAFLIALVAACTPTVLYHSICARADWALILCSWLILFALLRTADPEYADYRIPYTLLASAMAVYAYMSHTRGIVVVIALFLAVFLARFLFRQITLHIPTYLITTAALLLLDRLLTRWFKAQLWGTYGRGHSSVEVFDFSFLLKIFSFQGMKAFMKTVIGWFYSISTTTYGTLMVGFVMAVVILFRNLSRKKEKRNSQEELLAALFGVLLFIGSMLMSILFLFPYIYQIFQGASSNRADLVVYERYMVCTLGILILPALCLLQRKKIVRWKLPAFSFGAQAFCVLCAGVSILQVFRGRKYNRKMIAVLSVLFSRIKNKEKALLVIGIIGLVCFAVWLFFVALGKMKLALVCLLVLYLATFGSIWRSFRIKTNAASENAVSQNVKKLTDLSEIHEDYPTIFVMTKRNRRYGNVYQTSLMDFQAVTKTFTTFDELENAFVIRSGPFQSEEKLSGLYQFEDLSYDASTKQCLYVKGEELKEALEEMGQTLFPAQLPSS